MLTGSTNTSKPAILAESWKIHQDTEDNHVYLKLTLKPDVMLVYTIQQTYQFQLKFQIQLPHPATVTTQYF